MQGLHHVIGHDHESHCCSDNDVHVHDNEHSHSTCNICFFNFEPAEVITFDLTKSQMTSVFANSFDVLESHTLQQLRQACLRGPPSF